MEDKKLGGDTGKPPPELGFIDWINDATKEVKSKYSGVTLIDAVAKKQRLMGGQGKYNLDISARLRVSDGTVVTVTKDDDTFRISNPEDVLSGVGDVKDMTKVSYDPWKIISGNAKLQNYSSFRLYRPLGNVKAPNQSYYAFDNVQKTLFGASDGKEYKL